MLKYTIKLLLTRLIVWQPDILVGLTSSAHLIPGICKYRYGYCSFILISVQFQLILLSFTDISTYTKIIILNKLYAISYDQYRTFGVPIQTKDNYFRYPQVLNQFVNKAGRLLTFLLISE